MHEKPDASLSQPDPALREAVGMAASCGCPPSQLLMVALAGIQADTIDQTLDQLDAWRHELVGIVRDNAGPPSALAEPPQGPALARMRLEIADHELRDRLVFGDLLRRKSFFQVAALAFDGLEISSRDGELLDQLA
ncbi:MAG: hypothetical protein AAGC55_24140, partial [Myxococcota bacterium]